MGSDHGPVEARLKEAGESNIFKGQFGIPGTETMVPLMLNAVVQGKITLEQLTGILAETPARLYGLYPRKGVIQVGSDADFTIVDLSQSYKFEAQKMHTSCGWIPYEGWQVTGRITYTILRGKPVMRQGKICGLPGDGRFVRRF
jgi:dihydroorotase-like cyclic amidohydrolase